LNIEYKENILTAEDYLAIEKQMGGQYTTMEQAVCAMSHQLFSIAAVHNGKIIGIARLNGDAAIFWYVNDVWVLPEYRGMGIASELVNRLIHYIKTNSFPNTYVSVCLMAAVGKESFYEKFGFIRRPTENDGAGMELQLKF